MTGPIFSKKVTYEADKGGVNQLGELIGLVQPGDVAKIHAEAYVPVKMSICGLCSWTSKKTFLYTHVAGETAFLEFRPFSMEEEPSDPLSALLAEAIQGMALGESAVITCESFSSPTPCPRIHRGHLVHEMPKDEGPIIIEIDLFRVTRNGKEHFRPPRNGTGGKWMLGGMG